MAIIFIGSDSEKINSLRIPFTLSLYAGFQANDYTEIEQKILISKHNNLNYYGNDYNKHENICAYTKRNEYANVILPELQGFDYIFIIKEKEEEELFSIKIDNENEFLISTFNELNISYQLLEKNSKNFKNYNYIEIYLNPNNFNNSSLCELFFIFSKKIRAISNYNRWIHIPKGWMKTKDKCDDQGLFYLDTILIFEDNKKTIIGKNGIVKRGLLHFETEEKELLASYIYIPDGEKYAASGWVYLNNNWYFFSPKDYFGVTGKVIIDGLEYEINKGKLNSKGSIFYLDDNGILHKQ